MKGHDHFRFLQWFQRWFLKGDRKIVLTSQVLTLANGNLAWWPMKIPDIRREQRQMTTKKRKQMGRVSSKSRENVVYPRYVERNYRRSVIRNQLTYHLFCELLLSKCSYIHFVK